MKIRIYLYDEYRGCPALESINCIDVYRVLDKNRDVCWIYTFEQQTLSCEEKVALNHDVNIRNWELIEP